MFPVWKNVTKKLICVDLDDTLIMEVSNNMSNNLCRKPMFNLAPGAKKFLPKVCEMYDMYIITAREDWQYAECLVRMLEKRLKIKFCGMLTTSYQQKSEFVDLVIKNLKLDYIPIIIDDTYDIVKECKNVIIFGNADAPSDCKRCRNWKEVYMELKK